MLSVLVLPSTQPLQFREAEMQHLFINLNPIVGNGIAKRLFFDLARDCYHFAWI
jgi:hypothetical protein